MTPVKVDFSVRVNTDDSLSVTLGHREPGDAFLADLETPLESRTANQGAQGAQTNAQAGDAVVGSVAASSS